MKTFTFLAELKGGTYLSQKRGESLQEAFHRWIEDESPQFDCTPKQVVQLKSEYEDYPPTPVKDLASVWCFHCLLEGESLLVNVVETK